MVVFAQKVLILTHSLYYHLCLFSLTSSCFSFILIFLFVFSFLHNSVHNNVLFTEFFVCLFSLRSIHVPWIYLLVDFVNITTNQLLLTLVISVILICFTLFSSQIRLSDLIAARILRYTDFDTLIYTCAPEFDFMEKAV